MPYPYMTVSSYAQVINPLAIYLDTLLIQKTPAGGGGYT